MPTVKQRSESEVSWFQESPAPSLELIERMGVKRNEAVIDIGGGASRIADGLLDRGFEKISVLDLSAAALEAAKARLGDRGNYINWIVADATTWKPAEIYRVWHDRAAFHFLTDPADKNAYISRVKNATVEGSHIILGTFALDGPEKCSGLVVSRYDAASLADTLGTGFELVDKRLHEHQTPWGAVQRFQFSTFRRGH